MLVSSQICSCGWWGGGQGGGHKSRISSFHASFFLIFPHSQLRKRFQTRPSFPGIMSPPPLRDKFVLPAPPLCEAQHSSSSSGGGGSGGGGGGSGSITVQPAERSELLITSDAADSDSFGSFLWQEEQGVQLWKMCMIAEYVSNTQIRDLSSSYTHTEMRWHFQNIWWFKACVWGCTRVCVCWWHRVCITIRDISVKPTDTR